MSGYFYLFIYLFENLEINENVSLVLKIGIFLMQNISYFRTMILMWMDVFPKFKWIQF